MRIAGLAFDPDPLVKFVDGLAPANPFSKPAAFEQVAWGAPTSIATSNWVDRVPLPHTPTLAELGFLAPLPQPTNFTGPKVLPQTVDLAALSMPSAGFTNPTAVPNASAVAALAALSAPSTVSGGGGKVGTSWRVAKEVGEKVIPVVNAISVAKDVYDVGQWLFDKHQQAARADLNTAHWDGPIGNPYEPTAASRGQAV